MANLRETISDENYADLETVQEKMKVKKLGAVIELLIHHGRTAGFFDCIKPEAEEGGVSDE